MQDVVCRIPLRQRDGSVRGWAAIDASDFDWVNQWRWHLTRKGYVARSEHVPGSGKNGRTIVFLLHRELMGLPRTGRSTQVDHVDLDRLNNRRSNLRVVTTGEQAQNQRVENGIGRSSHRGVVWDGQRQRWQPTVTVRGRKYRGPSTTSELQAAECARRMRAELMTHAEG